MDSDYDYDRYDSEPDFDDYMYGYGYDSDAAELCRPEPRGNGDVRASSRVVTVVSGTTQSLNAIDCDQTVETWILKDAITALAQKSTEHKFNLQLNHLRFPGVLWSVSLSLPKEDGDTETGQMIFSHAAKFNGDTKRCWTSVVAELIRVVIMPEAASSERDQGEPNVEVLGAVSLGPNQLTDRESSSVNCEAWPLPLVQTAINDDGTLHIRLTLSLHDIDRAIRSRDLSCGLHQRGTVSDLTVKVDQEEFPVHKCVLAATSGEFKALLDSNPGDSLDLTGVGTASGVKAFLAHVYGAEYVWKCDSDPIGTIRNALLLAGQYKMKQIERQLIPVIQTLVSLDNVWNILTAAVENNASGVAAACYTFLLQNRGAIAKSELLTKLKVNSERDSKVRCVFIEVYFNQQLPCSPTCKCTKPPSIVRRNASDKPTLFPNEDFKLSISWEFRCPKADLAKKRELSWRAKEDPSLAQALGCRGSDVWWRLQLYPHGRNQAAQRQGCASFVLGLFTFDEDYDDEGYHARRNEVFSRWAYAVEFSLDVGGAKIAANMGAASKTLVEFTNKTKGLAVDCAWPASVLSDAVGADDKIIITAELRVLNVREVLSCCVETLSKSADSEPAARNYYMPLNQHTGSNTEHFQWAETWIIKDAAKALESSASLCSYHGGFGYQYAFEFKQHWAFPGVRLKIHPCHSRETKETPSFKLKAEFGRKPDSIRYCGALVIAEIKQPSLQVVAEATINSITLGPIELGDEQSELEGKAWPLEVMRSAINAEDDTLSIQLALILFNINAAVQTYRSIRELRTSGRGSDFIFKLGSEQFRAHKCVLATASEEFKKLLSAENQASELVLPEKTTASGVRAFLALVYFDAYDWQADANIADTISDVLYLSHQYRVERLKKQVVDAIVKIVSTSNVVRLLEAAVSCEASSAKDICITFLLENRAKIRNTDCVAQLLRNDRISGEFLSAFFGQNLCCSRSCDCAKPTTVSSNPATPTMTSRLRGSGKEKSIPKIGENELSYTWIIENAEASMDQPFLPQKRFTLDLGSRERSSSWVATMLPGGRTTIAQHEEFASFNIAFSGSFPEFCRADYFWAYVEASAENTTGHERVLFQFTPKSTLLLIDKFCPVATLRKAIRRVDNTLHIRVKISLIGDIPAALRCQEMMRVVYNLRAFADFVLLCNGELFQVHKSVLAQRSEVFAALLSSDMKEAQEGRLDLSDVTTVAGLKAFVDAVYFGELNCTDGDVLLELLKLANQYGLADVKSHCDQQLSRSIDMENVLDILATCELYGLQVAKSACVRFLGENGLKFLKSSTWQDLNKNESEVEILKSKVGLLQTLTMELLLRGKFRNIDE